MGWVCVGVGALSLYSRRTSEERRRVLLCHERDVRERLLQRPENPEKGPERIYIPRDRYDISHAHLGRIGREVGR